MKFLPAFFSLMLAGVSLAMASSPRDLMELILPPDLVLANADALGLSQAQEDSLKASVAPMQRQMSPAQQRMRALHEELVRLLSPAKPDEAAVRVKFAELEAAESKVKSLRVSMTLAVKAVLTAEQQEQAAKLHSPASSPTPERAEGGTIRDKLQRVRDGIERWQKEGRDVSEVRANWDEFQKRAEMRHHQLAMKALDDALALLEN